MPSQAEETDSDRNKSSKRKKRSGKSAASDTDTDNSGTAEKAKGKSSTKKVKKGNDAPAAASEQDEDSNRKSISIKPKKKRHEDGGYGTSTGSSSADADKANKKVLVDVLLAKKENPIAADLPSEVSTFSRLPTLNDEETLTNVLEDDETEDRTALRARGKSVYLSCFAGMDSIYFIIRLVIFLRLDVFHDYFQDLADREKLAQLGNKNATLIDIEAYYFCRLEELEKQCVWLFSVTWLCYFLGNVSLILSIIYLSLKLCYTYVLMKTTSIILNFLTLVFFGFYCLSRKFYIETAVFFIVHLPIQIFGTKRTRNYAISLKRTEMENTARRLFPERDVQATESGGSLQRKKSVLLQRRKSYQLVTTVDA